MHDGIAGNATFPSPIPTTAEFQALIDALAVSNAAVDANKGRQDYLVRNIADRNLRAAIKQWKAYVQMVSGGDADLIRTTNFGVSKRPEPRGELPPPRNLGVRLTNFTGRAALVWNSETGADMHHVYMSTSNDPFKWELIGVTTKSRFNADHLEPGTFYWFAVTAINTRWRKQQERALPRHGCSLSAPSTTPRQISPGQIPQNKGEEAGAGAFGGRRTTSHRLAGAGVHG